MAKIMCRYCKLNGYYLVTNNIEEALFLMRDKPADLIKPVVKLSD